jgi:2-polyprenyl-3-methyl-5-hydroxy-6-metoxy-1,4-benzoquinol methylase
MEILEQCSLCEQKNLEKFYEGTDKYYSQKFIKCSACTNCSLIFLNPRPTKEEYKQWYESVFQDKRRNYTTVGQVVEDIKSKNKYANKLKEMEYFKNIVTEDSACLDIGAGWGTLAKVVSDKFHCSVDAIEPSNLAAQVAREHYGLNTYNELFDNFIEREQGKKKYNVIYAYHVFEHMSNPNIFLENVKKLLQPNAALLLALPNTANPEVESSQLFHIDHCFYYTPRTIKMMLEKHGFKVNKIWIDKNDMKVLCSADSQVARIGFENLAEYKQVLKAIKQRDHKNKFLRIIKKIIYLPLTRGLQNKANRLITKILYN